MNFMSLDKKRSIFVINSYLKDSADKKKCKPLNKVPFDNRRYTKGVHFS